MSVDITDQFLEFVRSLEKQNIAKVKNNSNNAVENSSDFKTQSVKLLETIFNLRQMLENILEEYVSFSSFNTIHSKCQEMENSSENLMKLCQECLNNIRSGKYFSQKLPQDIKLHRKAVTEMLTTYLKGCHQIHSEISEVKKLKQKPLIINKNSLNIDDRDGSIVDFHGGLDVKQMEQLQLNTEGVHKRLTLQLEEKAEIEKKIHEISRLNEQLSENVFEQHTLVNRIEDNSLTANLNVDSGDNELKKAMQNQSGTRFWILFILIVLSIALLFIDWYNS